MTFIRVDTVEELMSERSWKLLFELSFSSSLLSLSPLMFLSFSFLFCTFIAGKYSALRIFYLPIVYSDPNKTLGLQAEQWRAKWSLQDGAKIKFQILAPENTRLLDPFIEISVPCSAVRLWDLVSLIVYFPLCLIHERVCD